MKNVKKGLVNNMRKKLTYFFGVIMLLIILLKLLPTPIDTIYIKEYESSEKVFGNDVQYELGINVYGDIVFENPSIALKKFKKDNEMALSAIGKEYTLDDFSYKNYKIYGQIGWQFNPDDQEMLIQSNRISHFADIYENSFNRSGNELVSFICSMLFNRFGTEVSQ